MKLSLMLVLASFLLTSCSTTLNKSQQDTSIDLRIKSHLKADVDVDMNQKLSATVKQTKVLWFIPVKSAHMFADGVSYDGHMGHGGWFGPGMVEETKSAAAYQAVVNKADVIVAPKYIVKVHSIFFGLWKEVTATVTGYAGRVKYIGPDQRAMK